MPRVIVLLGLAAALSSCAAPTIYRDTWRPTTSRDVYPRLLIAALAVEPDDVDRVLGAGGEIIGYHATRKAYGVRAGSVGGTHFVAVAGSITAHTSCASSPLFGGFAVSACSTTSGFRPTKIAVIRVPAGNWVALPPHLVPPTSDVDEGVSVQITREGCTVNGGWGTVRCSNDWHIKDWP